MCDHPEHQHEAKPQQLFLEAFIVGATIVPLWWLVAKATTAMRINITDKSAMDVALTGFFYHLIAEESGLNGYYLTNSYASQKAFSASFSDASTVLRNPFDVWGPHRMGYFAAR